jgi:hypothetical protein
MKTAKMRKSSNVQDLRDPKVAHAHNMGQDLQNALDDIVLMRNEAQTMNSATARWFEKDSAYQLDAVGTKGKGRLGGGRSFRNRVEKAASRTVWRKN